MTYHIAWIGATLALVGCMHAPVISAARPLPGGPLPMYRVLAAATADSAVVADASERTALAVTVYTSDLALVSDTRAVSLPAGTVRLRFTDVSERLDAGSVSLRAAQGTLPRVLEQLYAFDVLTPESVLERYIGREIALRRPAEGDGPATVVTGTLVSVKDGLIVEIDGKLHVRPAGEVVLPELPDGLSAEPTLEWRLADSSGGDRRLAASYQTSGVSWQADYTLRLGDGETARLSGAATVTNRSGIPYPDATITLVAGEINRTATAPVPAPMAAVPERAADRFTEAPLDVYHTYRLDRPATLKDGATTQLPLFEPAAITVTREYIFESGRAIPYANDQPVGVEVKLKFENRKENGLGLPLPQGRVRIEDATATGEPKLLGEDRIGHVPAGETVTVTQGRAFDVVGERKQTKVEQLGDNVRKESYRVVLRNHGDRPVTVKVVEHLYGDWQVTSSSPAFEKRDADTIVFTVPVPANGEASVDYTAQIRS